MSEIIMSSSSSPSNKGKQVKTHSVVWEFFKTSEDGSKRQCLHCDTSYSSSTSTAVMARHLEKVHESQARRLNELNDLKRMRKKYSRSSIVRGSDIRSPETFPSGSISLDDCYKKFQILCFGDSLTWGADPNRRTRLPYDSRWCSVMEAELSSDIAHVIPEGLNGRTMASEDSATGSGMYSVNGRAAMRSILHSHKPLDIVILFLGTNDLKHRFSLLPVDIAKNTQALIRDIQTSGTGVNNGAPEIIVMSPPILEDTEEAANWGFLNASDKSKETIAQMKKFLFLENQDVKFFETSKHVNVGKDGVHLDGANHTILGKEVAKTVKNLLHQVTE